MNEETAKNRVEKELAELEERAEKLFADKLCIPFSFGTETEAYSLLILQVNIMRTYANILRRRLAIWDD